jgi:hypothetical protein
MAATRAILQRLASIDEAGRVGRLGMTCATADQQTVA